MNRIINKYTTHYSHSCYRYRSEPIHYCRLTHFRPFNDSHYQTTVSSVARGTKPAVSRVWYTPYVSVRPLFCRCDSYGMLFTTPFSNKQYQCKRPCSWNLSDQSFTPFLTSRQMVHVSIWPSVSEPVSSDSKMDCYMDRYTHCVSSPQHNPCVRTSYRTIAIGDSTKTIVRAICSPSSCNERYHQGLANPIQIQTQITPVAVTGTTFVTHTPHNTPKRQPTVSIMQHTSR